MVNQKKLSNQPVTRKYILIVTALILSLNVFAQVRTVSGVIVDTDGAPIVSAAIAIKGTFSGTSSDAKGNFSITLSEGNLTLVVSCLGYVTKEVKEPASDTKLTVVLENDNKLMEEVVVTAYRQQKRISVTGSVSAISSKDVKQAPVANFATALTGRLSGLTVNQNSGQPGRENVRMFLRGRGTSGDASPLILVDGVPREDITSIDPNEVESISVLKDASSTAVFGVRGANGVILVTTRRGNIGAPELSITIEQSLLNYTYRPDRIHSLDYATMMNQAEINDNPSKANDPWSLTYTPYMLERYSRKDSPLYYPDRDIYNEFVKDFAQQRRVNMNMSGGTKDARYFINLSYLQQGSIFKHESEETLGYNPEFALNRLNFRSNIDYKVTKGLNLFINLGGYINNVNFPPNSDNPQYSDPDLKSVNRTLWQIYRQRPTTPGAVTPEGWVDDYGRNVPAGDVLTDQFGTNARVYGELNQSGYVNQTLSTLNSTLGASWDLEFITKGLSTKFMISYDFASNEFVQGSRQWRFWEVTVPKRESENVVVKNLWDSYDSDPALSFRQGRGADYKMNLQYSFDYKRLFGGKHEVTALVLFQRDNWVQSTSDPLLPFNTLGLSGLASYVYDNKYILEVNVGYNGSEQFSEDKRFGFFPAFSGSWNVDNERFFKNIKAYISKLKLRASYGMVGNDKIGNQRFLYLDDITLNDGGPFSSLGRGAWIDWQLIGNPDLTWETAKKQNYGVDLNFLDGFTLTADYYREMREDILLTRSTVPEFPGIERDKTPRVNMGKISNKGVEVELGYGKPFNQDFSISIKGNFGFNRNKVLEWDETELETGKGKYMYPYRRTGFPIGQPWGLLVDYESGAGNGFINTDEELELYKGMYESYFGSMVRKGDLKYKDMNGDRKIDEKDFMPIGYAFAAPEITYAGIISVMWKNFDLSLMFQGVAHRNSRIAGEEFNGFISGGYQFHAWTQERFENGEEILYPALTKSSSNVNTWNKNGGNSEFVLENRSFLRLKNMEVGYTLPQRISQKGGLKNVRIAVTGQNLWTLDWMRSSFSDPEVENENNYPIMRTVNFVLNLKF